MTAKELKPGQRLGRYELMRPIASGGMATVWAARLIGPRGFQKIVAVKVMLPTLHDEPGVEDMFLAEARLASRIRHPNVVEVLDLGDEDGWLHLVMEWVHGAPLTTIVAAARKGGGLGLGVVLGIVRQVCKGLQAAHDLTDEHGVRVGLVHRDVSPHNVLVGFNGVAKVADFGIAKVTAASGVETMFGQLKGKIAYMAPEQLRLEPVDERTDVFAVGILLYMLTTGVHPFKRDEQHETVRELLSPEPVRPPSDFIERYPAGLERILQRALAKEPADRYPSAGALELDLAKASPPTSKGAELIQDCMRRLLPDVYEEGLALARGALETLAPATSQSGSLPSQPKSSSTFRAVAIPIGEARGALEPEEEEPERLTEYAPEPTPRRSWGVVAGLSALGAVVAVAGITSYSMRSSPSNRASASAGVSSIPVAAEPSSVTAPAPSFAEPAAAPEVAPSAAPSPGKPARAAAPVVRKPAGAAPVPVKKPRAPASPSQPGSGLKDPYAR